MIREIRTARQDVHTCVTLVYPGWYPALSTVGCQSGIPEAIENIMDNSSGDIVQTTMPSLRFFLASEIQVDILPCTT